VNLGKKTDWELVQQKLDLYSSLIYHFDQLKYQNDALEFARGLAPSGPIRFAYTDEQWRHIINDIDSRIENRTYLLSRRILERWVWARTLTNQPIAIEIMPELRRMLIEEFNQIRSKYLRLIPDIIPAISLDPEVQSIGQNDTIGSTGAAPRS
jgi:hypothetical protein